MRITRIAAAEIDGPLALRWRGLQTHPGCPQWRHPFLSADLARLTGEVRPTSRVAVIEDAGAVVGLWAFDEPLRGFAWPLARHMSDLQCPLIDPHWAQTRADFRSAQDRHPAHLLQTMARACGLVRVHYDHLLSSRAPDLIDPPDVLGHPQAREGDPWRVGWMIDLAQGFAVYRREQERQTRWWRRTEGKARRWSASVGSLSFTEDVRDDEAWLALARWKSMQYRQSGLRDNFSIRWIRQWLERLRWSDTPALRGALHVLRADGRVVAVHFGFRGDDLLHHYLPAFDRNLSMHSPGNILLAHLLEQAPGAGLRWIDFSVGDMEFKQAISNAPRLLAQGVIGPTWMKQIGSWMRQTQAGLRQCPGLLPVARRGKRVWRALANGPRPTGAR